MFDVWSQALDCEFLREITIDEVTEDNYRDWISLAQISIDDKLANAKATIANDVALENEIQSSEGKAFTEISKEAPQ